MNTKITVVLPVYNGEAYLEEAILSVLNQTYANFELLIVDDCSNDQSAAIAQKYAAQYAHVSYIRNETNLKLPGALNRGFALATGQYWTWTSCDNSYLPTALERLVLALESDPELGLVYTDMQTIDAAGKTLAQVSAGPADELILRNVVGACFLYRANIAKKAGEYNRDLFLCEDYEYWLRLACITKLKPINESLYKYRVHNKSLSNEYKSEVISKGIKVQKQYYSNFIKTRKMAARFYAYLRARDIYNPLRQLYLLIVLFYSPRVFINEIQAIISGRMAKHAQN